MDGFGDSFVPPVDDGAGEVDPAAEFLAREQDQLAGLDDDIIPPAVPAATPLQMDGPSAPAHSAPGLEADLFGATPMNGAPSMNGAPDLESFEMLGGDEMSQGAAADAPSAEAVAAEEVFTEPAPPEGAPEHEGDYSGFGADYGGASVPTDAATSVGDLSFVGDPQATEAVPSRPMAYSPIPSVPREEPEKIKIWRQQQEVRLEEKDAAEELAKAELKKKAQRELEDWYKQHEEQVAKTRQANREASKSAEKELVADIGKMEPGTEWERIAKLCNFNPKTSKSSRDISRMRSIILQVKQNPPLKA